MIYLTILVMGLFAAGSCYAAIKERKARRQTQKELDEVKQNAENMAEIITEAEKDKSEVRTGDHAHDLHTMADKLHEYANAGK